DCGRNELTYLKLNNCLNLKRLFCYDNKLTKLEIDNSPKLVRLDCRDNFLTDLEVPFKNLIYLTVRNNNLSKRNLSMFSELFNLEVLYINTDLSYQGDCDPRKHKEKLKKGIYNKFEGSLKYLEKLTKLRELNISNTDIDGGWEYLPGNLEEFYCSADIIKDAKVKVIEEIYRHFDKDLQKLEESTFAQRWLNKNYPEDGKVPKKESSHDGEGSYG